MTVKATLFIILGVLAAGGLMVATRVVGESGDAPAAATGRADADDVPAETGWMTDYEAALARAERDGKLVAVDFFATWCGPCKMMDRQTFSDPRVRELIDHYQGGDRVAFLAVQTVFEGFDTNTPERALATAERYQLDILVGHDGARGTPSTLMRDYRTRGTPWTVIIDREGIVRYSDFHIDAERAVELIDGLLL